MKIRKCFNCGKKFIEGNDPRTGLPNGIGMKMNSGRTYDVCSKCVSFKTNEVNKKIMEAENMPMKKIGTMTVPENFDVKEFEEMLVNLGSDPKIIDLLTNAEEGGKTGIRETINNVKSLGIKLDQTKKMGLLVHFSAAQAEHLWNHVKDKSEEEIIDAFAQSLMRYYYSIMETIEAEEIALGREN